MSDKEQEPTEEEKHLNGLLRRLNKTQWELKSLRQFTPEQLRQLTADAESDVAIAEVAVKARGLLEQAFRALLEDRLKSLPPLPPEQQQLFLRGMMTSVDEVLLPAYLATLLAKEKP